MFRIYNDVHCKKVCLCLSITIVGGFIKRSAKMDFIYQKKCFWYLPVFKAITLGLLSKSCSNKLMESRVIIKESENLVGLSKL